MSACQFVCNGRTVWSLGRFLADESYVSILDFRLQQRFELVIPIGIDQCAAYLVQRVDQRLQMPREIDAVLREEGRQVLVRLVTQILHLQRQRLDTSLETVLILPWNFCSI